MAHQTLASAWLYSNSSAFDVQFFEKSWSKKYELPYFDFEVVGIVSGEKRIGRGIDRIREVALEKASAEFLENYICLENQVSSIGASLTSYQEFEKHALNEAYERYYLDQHLQLEIPLLRQQAHNNYLGGSSLSPQIKFYKFNSAYEHHGILCKISDDQKNFNSYGFSCSNSIEASLEKSFIEALPNFLYLIEKGDNELLPWQLTQDFNNQINPLLLNQLPNNFISQLIPDPVFKKVELKTPVLMEKLDFPFKVIKFNR